MNLDAHAVAAIDCGTNSIRLLIAQPQPDGSLKELQREMRIVRLGEAVDKTGKFDPKAISRTLDALGDYAKFIEHHGAKKLRFVATSATRDAENRQDFIAGVYDLLGIEPEVISGDEEAKLSFRGAVLSLPNPGPSPRLVIDIGGGSTEFVLGDQSPNSLISVNVGSGRITERHFRLDKNEPPSKEQILAATADIDQLIDEAQEKIDFSAVKTVIGVAGTVTTLTAIELGHQVYNPFESHGAFISAPAHIELARKILSMSSAQRAQFPAIHPGRLEVIGAGALIWARILERISQKAELESVITSEHDILDGIAMSIA